MTSIILAISLALIVTLLIIRFERKIHKTYLTPTVLLIVPFVAVCLTWLIVGYPLGFIQPSAEGILFLKLCFFLFWVGGIFATFASPKKFFGIRVPTISKRGLVWTKRLSLIMLLALVSGLVYYVIKFGVSAAWGAYALEETYGRGLTGHIRILSHIPFIVLCSYLSSKDRWGWAICIAMLLCYLAYPVRSWTILPLVSAVISRHLVLKWRPRVATVLWVILAGYAIFLGSYVLAFWVRGGLLDWAITLRFVNYHILTYLFSGLLAFGQVFENYGPPSWAQQPELLFSSLVNIYRVVFTGEPLLNPVNPNFVVIHPELGKAVNVYTLFGSVWFHLGAGYTLFFAFFLGIFIYLLWKIAGSSNSPYLFAASCFWLTALVFGWFEYYYWHLPFVQLLVVTILVEVVRRLRWSRSHVPAVAFIKPSLREVSNE